MNRKQRIIVGALAACVPVVLVGCYSRVVEAKGIGADQRHPKQSERTEPVRARDFFNTTSDKAKD